MADEDRVYTPHSMTPWRGKDYDRCNTCGLPKEGHDKIYEQSNLCGKPIEGIEDTVCDQPTGHDKWDPEQNDSSNIVCSGIRGNAR